jgi:hypothetical protein
MEDRASSCFRGVTDAGATLTKPTLLLMDAKVSRATILLTTLQRLSKERHHSHCKSRSSRWLFAKDVLQFVGELLQPGVWGLTGGLLLRWSTRRGMGWSRWARPHICVPASSLSRS